MKSKKHLSMCARIANVPRRVLRGQLPCLLLTFVVLLLGMSALMPVAQAPNYSERTWDIAWDGNNVYPDDDDPTWTRATTGTVSRSFVYHTQIMNLSLTGASADNEKYSVSFGATEYAYAEARVKMPIAGAALYLRFDSTSLYTFVYISSTSIQLAYPNIQTQQYTTITHYEENIIGANHTYGLLYYTDGIESYYAVYYDHNLAIWLPSQVHTMEIDEFYFSTQDAPPSASGRYAEWDYVALDLTDTNAKIRQLEDDITELQKALERLKKQTNPDVVTNQTELPTIPYRSRGLDDDLEFIDPYRTLVATVKAEGTGTSVALHLPYSTSADEVTCIQDDLWIGGTFTRIYINTTGAVSLLDSTATYTYFGDLDCQNVTVETIGGDVIVNRITVVREIDSFAWGWNRDSGTFIHRSTISNSISYNMANVRCYWSFPDEDADGVSVNVDGSSIQVWDADNNLELEAGKHWEATEIGGISLEYAWVNTSGTTAIRTVRLQFNRLTYTETEEYYTVRDNDITISDTYAGSPFTVHVTHTQSGASDFVGGKVIIKFSLTGKYAGNHLDTRTLYIKRSDSSLFQEFTYDSIANELRITDVTISAGESIVFVLYFDWYDESSALYTLILGDPLILYSLLLLAGFSGLFIYLDATKEEKRRKYAGIIIIAVDVVILVIILVVS